MPGDGSHRTSVFGLCVLLVHTARSTHDSSPDFDPLRPRAGRCRSGGPPTGVTVPVRPPETAKGTPRCPSRPRRLPGARAPPPAPPRPPRRGPGPRRAPRNGQGPPAGPLRDGGASRAIDPAPRRRAAGARRSHRHARDQVRSCAYLTTTVQAWPLRILLAADFWPLLARGFFFANVFV